MNIILILLPISCIVYLKLWNFKKVFKFDSFRFSRSFFRMYNLSLIHPNRLSMKSYKKRSNILNILLFLVFIVLFIIISLY